MELVYPILIIVIIVFFIITALLQRYYNNKKTNFFHTMSKITGLMAYNNEKLDGEFQGHRITCDYSDKSAYYNFRITVIPPENELYEMNISSEPVYRPNKTDIQTGDYKFDSKVFLQSFNPDKTLANLTSEIRTLIRSYFDYNMKLTIFNGQIILHRNSTYNAQELKAEIDNLICISKALSNNDQITERIMNNIKKEKKIQVRIENMKRLMTSPNQEKFRDLYREMADVKNGDLAVLAASKLGAEGIPCLIQCLKLNGQSIQKKAIDNLTPYLEKEEVMNGLFNLLNWSKPKVTIYLLKLLTKKEMKIYDTKILKYFDRNYPGLVNSPEILLQIIKFFTSVNSNIVLTRLYDLLKHEEINKIPVIRAIGQLGDVKSIEHIYPYTKGMQKTGIKKAAGTAVNKLQYGIPKEHQGNLTVVDHVDTGELSLAHDEDRAGNLSLEEESN